MKKVIGIILFGILYHCASAQQQGQFSQYMLNYYLVNPAVAGSQNDIIIKTSFRGQWVGINGAPVNYYLSGQTALGKVLPESQQKRLRPKQGVGFIFSGQELGPFKRNGLYATYAYHMPVSNSTYVSIGASAGLLNYQLNRNKIIFSDDNSDAVVENINNQYLVDANAGIYVHNKKFFAGISSMQLLRNKLAFNDTSSVYGFLNRHLHFMGGYNFSITEDLVLIPSVLIKSVAGVSVQADINALLTYQNKYWGGISYRKQDAIVFLAGLRISDIAEVGYSYDITTSSLSMTSRGSHEIVLGARFRKKTMTICPGEFW